MGCGGSKEDVATGNNVSRPLLRRQGSSARNSLTKSSTTTSSSASRATHDSSKQLNQVINGGFEEVIKTPVSIAKIDDDEVQLPTSSSKNDDDDDDHVEKATLALEAYGDAAASEAKTGAGNEKSEALEEEEEKEKRSPKDDDGESLGKHSGDFKEAISVVEEEEEEEEGETVSGKEDSAKTETVIES